jgi:predicted ATPase
MITKIEIDGFKTFREFQMEFSPCTIIAGTNSSGKSNLFDALQLLSRLAEVDLRTAFSEQRGNAEELFTQFSEDNYAKEMSFAIEVLLNKNIKDNWGQERQLKYTRLRYELKIRRRKNEIGLEDLFVFHEFLDTLKHDQDPWVKSFLPKDTKDYWRPKVPVGRRTTPYIETEEAKSIIIRQDDKGGNKKEVAIFAGITQTILSSVNSVDFKHALALKEEMKNWKFLQLNPQSLREPTRQDIGMRDTISQSGENLAAALHRIKLNDEFALRDISRKINNLLPNLTEVNVYNDTANKQFIIKVKSEDNRIFSSRVLSEGTLRLLALCIFQYDDEHNGLLCFEEPENGIHPAKMKEMAKLLMDLSVDFENIETPLRQVFVNTHSPLLVGEIFSLHVAKTTVWFSQLVTKFIVVENKKIKIHATKILPVEPDVKHSSKSRLTLNFPEPEKKLILNELKNYLENPNNKYIDV